MRQDGEGGCKWQELRLELERNERRGCDGTVASRVSFEIN